MATQCSQDSFDFGTVEGRRVVARFDGGDITSNAGALLLGAADKAIGLVRRLTACFHDERDPDLIEHAVATMVGQRIFGHALGHEDLNDHDRLRHDPVLATLAGKLEAKREACAPLAGKSTLNRLELSLRGQTTRYCKIGHDAEAIAELFVDLFLESYGADAGGHQKRRARKPPKRITLDMDATHDPIHGMQEGRAFSAFYDCYCYLPLYVFCGRHLLCARLRSVDKDAADGAVEELARIVAHIRSRWPKVKILLRADSGFARDDIMVWCKENRVDYVLGLARNPRLVGAIARELVLARRSFRRTGQAARRYANLDSWQTRESWSRSRRVVAKAEWIDGKANPRFVVTSLHRAKASARYLYENVYCERGEMENRFKEVQGDLFADRTSTGTFAANQLRLWFASFSYVLMCALRRLGLQGTALAKATCGTIRLRLLKIGAIVTRSVRRVKIALSSACPDRELFATAARRLVALRL